jgi:hypothetical protein
MVGCGLERGSNDTRECRVVNELRAKTVLALFSPLLAVMKIHLPTYFIGR